jgi:hypothetical protein
MPDVSTFIGPRDDFVGSVTVVQRLGVVILAFVIAGCRIFQGWMVSWLMVPEVVGRYSKLECVSLAPRWRPRR